MKLIAAAVVVVCCFQVAWGSCASFDQMSYEIFEDIGLDDLALRVCFEAEDDCDVQFLTESKSATGLYVVMRDLTMLIS